MTFHKIDMQAWERKRDMSIMPKRCPHIQYDGGAGMSQNCCAGCGKRGCRFFPWSYMGLHGRSTGMRNFGWPRMKWEMWDITATATPVIRFSIRRQKASRRFGRHTMRRLRCFWRGIGRIWRGTGMLRSFQSRPAGKNLFNVSCIPWSSFTGFNLNLQNGYDYFLPIFTIGKYFFRWRENAPAAGCAGTPCGVRRIPSFTVYERASDMGWTLSAGARTGDRTGARERPR